MLSKSKKLLFLLIFAASIGLAACTNSTTSSNGAVNGVSTQKPIPISTTTTYFATPISTPKLASPTPKPTTYKITCLNGTYINSFGNTVCRPEQAPSIPPGASAICGDGTYSFSQSRRGTCSHHGGVSQWL